MSFMIKAFADAKEKHGLTERIPHGDSSKEDQFDFFMNKNPRKYEWYSDPQGTVTAGWGSL